MATNHSKDIMNVKAEEVKEVVPEAAPHVSKKVAKKEAKKVERLANKQMAAASAIKASLDCTATASTTTIDPLAGNCYGDLPLEVVQSKVVTGKKWTKVADVSEALVSKEVLVRGQCHAIREMGSKTVFLVVREAGYTLQCVFHVDDGNVSKGMLRYISKLNKESVVDVVGVASTPNAPIKGTTQQVELKAHKVFCVSKAAPGLPFVLEDAARSDSDIQKAEQEGKLVITVGQDIRLNNRVLDLRTPANQAIFRIQSFIMMFFRQFLLLEGFIEIRTPKLIGGASEGGSAVFKLNYKGQPSCLAQSPQLHKQMAICANFGRVFEIGPVFRAEDSFTHRHLCEFTGLDLEMEIKEHYSEVLDIIDQLFVYIFDELNEKCRREMEAIDLQYPFEPLKYHRKTLRLTFEEGFQLLKDNGIDTDPFGDLNTETERKLGQLVKQKYDTDFYILHRYPLACRPFYTMPCPDDSRYSNSFDVFIRGEEIISGAQRIHDVKLLVTRAQACGVDVKTLSTYIDSFKWGVVPHGGAGAGCDAILCIE